MNEPTFSHFKDESDGPGMGSKIWSLAQKVIGPLVVALVTFLAIDRGLAWTAIGDGTHALGLHKEEEKSRHALLGLSLESMQADIDELSDGVSNCQLQMQRVLIEMARLPPDVWENRIMKNKHEITILKGRIREE